jgi:hypothetical protein
VPLADNSTVEGSTRSTARSRSIGRINELTVDVKLVELHESVGLNKETASYEMIVTSASMHVPEQASSLR